MRHNFLFLFLMLTSSFIIAQTTFCLNLAVVSSNDNELIVSVEVQGNESFKLGNSNFQFNFDNNAFTSPTLLSHRLTVAPFPVYQVPTVTTPQPAETSLNVELNVPGFGDEMSGPESWTEIAQIRFEKTGTEATRGMTWSYNGGTTQTVSFLDDQATQVFASDVVCLGGVSLALLPVEIKYFNAIASNNKSKLTWATTQEENNHGFFIEHSADGLEFNDIAFVEGKNQAADYIYWDEYPIDGINYYRLRQVDFDGKFKHFEVRDVEFENEGDISFYPNPTRNTLHLRWNTNKPITQIVIYNISGQMVIQKHMYSHELDVSSLANGSYIVQLQTENSYKSSRLIIAR